MVKITDEIAVFLSIYKKQSEGDEICFSELGKELPDFNTCRLSNAIDTLLVNNYIEETDYKKFDDVLSMSYKIHPVVEDVPEKILKEYGINLENLSKYSFKNKF